MVGLSGLRGLFQGNQVCGCVGAVPPDIVGEEQNVSVLLGQALELRCRSNAVPPPRLTWLKDGRPLLQKPGLSISGDGSMLKVSWAQPVLGFLPGSCTLHGWLSIGLSGAAERSVRGGRDVGHPGWIHVLLLTFRETCKNKIET